MGLVPWCLLSAVVWLPRILSSDLYSNQPKLITDDGNLVIMTAADRNITLRTSGRGYVNLNDHNLLHVTQMAQQASASVSRFQQNLETNIQGRLDTLTRQISGPRGLTTKLATLEQAVYRGNVSSGLPEPPASTTISRLNRQASRIRRIEIQLRRLQNLLTKDECLSTPCHNGGTCQDLFNDFMCICPDNWQGTQCDVDVNECAMYAGTDLGCQNGGTCVNKPGSYECLCPDSYFGLHCTLRLNDCSAANSAQLCGNGVCVNQGGTGRGFTCICNQGWTTDSSQSCTVDVDECQAKRYPCSHDPYVPCINLPGSFHCGFCPPGYSGNGFQCADIDECQTNNGGCSQVPRVPCINTMGSRVCGSCPAGFSGDGVTCIPLAGGACAVNNGGCFPTAHCFLTGGIVNCQCPDGYTGTGYGPNGCSASAMAVNPCHNNPCRNGGSCTPVLGKAVCSCLPHTTGAECDQIVYDTCNPNPCLNDGQCSIEGDWSLFGLLYVKCTCRPGYEGSRCEYVSSGCGGELRQDSGEVQFPNGIAQSYDSGQRCTWHIEVSFTKVVQINITELMIDPSESCRHNYLKIEDPTPLGVSHTFCKQYDAEKPHINATVSNKADVTYFSTTGIRSNTFKLTWKAVEPVCGSEISATTHGTIDSPQILATHPASLDCEWKIFAPPGKKIHFMFNSLNLQPSRDCTKDYIQIREYENREPGNMLAQYCNSSNPVSVTTHLNTAYILFHSGGSSNVTKGFKIMYSVMDGCGTVLTNRAGDISPPMENEEYKDDLDCEWRIQMPVGDRINLVFNKFELEVSDPCDDYVQVRDGPSPTSPLVGQWCGSILPPPFTSTSQFLTIIFHSDFLIGASGFTIHYEISCGGEFTSASGEIKSPNYPLPYYQEQSCVYRISTPPSTAIELHFLDFEMEHLDETCSFDFLEIYDGDSANSSLLGRYCDQSPGDIVSTHNYLYLVFTADGSDQYRGFFANYSTIDIPCGGILKEKTGTFSAPQNEDGYLPEVKCVWVISAQPGWVIQLSFLSFHLEYSQDCTMDAVEVYQNDTATGENQLVDKYCGLKIPPPTSSTTNMMTVKFHSDDSVHREGFTAHYVMVDKTKVCSATYRTITGTLESPNYPKNYPSNKECTWVIHVPQGQQIKLSFQTFNLEMLHGMCVHDSLTIRNGLHETSPLVGKYCGSDLPPDVISLSNGLWIHFSSDRSVDEKGFKATWDATATGCEGTLTGMSGSITSPNYPQPYRRNADCKYRISVSQGSLVRIFIVDLDLEPSSTCRLDYIEIFDGPDNRSPSLGRFCKPDQHPNSLVATSNIMYLKFESDISYNGRGFNLQYVTDCNVTLKSRYGAIESPNFPNKYNPNLNCMWVIQAPLGNRLNITIDHFELEHKSMFGSDDSKDCGYDYVEISQSALRESSPKQQLAKLCGDGPETKLYSTTVEKAYIHFHTDHMIEGAGFRLEWAVVGCGGLMRKPEGSFTSPNYPHGYPLNVECEWEIIAPWDKSIEITLRDLHMEDAGECGFDHFAIYAGEDDTAPLLIKACHDQTTPQTFSTSGNHAFIRFQSDHSMNGKGFYASWKFRDAKCGGKFTSPFGAIFSHNYPNNYDNNDDCEWLIEVPENHLVNLTFTDFDVEVSSENMTTDYVNVYDGSSVKAPLLLSHSGNELPRPAYVVSTGNTLLVRHKADGSLTAKGFSAHYTLACGARILANGTGTFSLTDTVSSASPWANDDLVNCTWFISAQNPVDKITLTFTLLDLSPSEENDEAECSYNYVAVHDGDDTNAHIVSRVCGTKVPPTLRSSGSALTVQAARLMGFRSHLGRFTALYSTFSSACGGDLVSEQGSFASPQFPDGYPADADCEWTIMASVGNKVTVSFSRFELEQSDFCNTDYVEVRSGGSDGTLLGVFCGSNLPTNITAQNVMWLRFRSDSLNTAAGFMADYSLVHGNELAGEAGQIASPLYPNPFIQKGEYKWTITVPNNKVVRITFSAFYMDQYEEGECPAVYMKIFDGLSVDGSSPPLLEACGAALPSPVVSRGNTVAILFYNGPYVHGSIFLLNWEAVSRDRAFPPTIANTSNENSTLGCGKLIHLSPNSGNHSVTFTSPNHPQKYTNNISCAWIIDTSVGFHLQLKFTAFELETYEDCGVDFVKVFEESETEATGWKAISDDLCLPSTTSLTFQTGNRMNVMFKTDESIAKTGFSAVVTAVCGGTLTASSGSLNTTKLPKNAMGKVACEWLIAVRPGRTIQFKFTEFNLVKPSEGPCREEFIMFRNGGFNDSPPLGDGKYCGGVTPLIPPSTSNRVFLSYSSFSGVASVVLEYEEVDFACGHDIVLGNNVASKVISTPNYPQVPSTSHITCTWSVSAPAGESIKLDFTHRFDLKPSTGCTVEYLEVYDGGTELAPLLGRYCSVTPAPITSLGNHMFIKYFTDADIPNNGFKADVSIATCGGTYFGLFTPITLTSPQYPDNYSPKLDCVWRIVGYSEDTQIQVRVSELFLDGKSGQCNDTSDFIEFINVDFVTKNMTDSPPATKLCGQYSKEFNSSALVPPSSSSELYIRFHSGQRTTEYSKFRFSLSISIKRQRCFFEVDAPSGVITSRGYPTPMPRTTFFYCVWSISVPEGRRVSLKVVDFDPDPLHFPMQAKMMFFSNNQYVGGLRLSSDDYSKPMYSFSNNMRVIYTEASISGAHRGFKAEFSSEPLPCGGALDDSGAVSFSALGQNLTQYYCKWTHTRDPHSNNQSTFTISVNGTISVPRNASSPPCNFYSNIYDSLLISTGLSDMLALICQEEKFPYVVRTSSDTVNIVARKSALSSRETVTPSIANFSISFKTDLCGGFIKGPEAVITSPGFPSVYPPDTDCSWNVKFEEGSTIRIMFDQLDLDADCNNDFLILYNGGTQMDPHLTHPLCGNEAPSQIITQTNELLVEFHSGKFKTIHNGFKMVLKEETSGCGGTLHDFGTIMSPNFGNKDYPNNVECDWNVVLSPGYHAGITFDGRFSLESSTGCANDYIKIFDWTNETWVQIGDNICGRDPPKNITTKTNKFRVLFRTSSTVTSDGFSLVWKNLCGGTFEVKEGGTIISPRYPKLYSSNLNCKYVLLAPSKTIYGSFDDFAVEETELAGEKRCKYDNVTISTHSLAPHRLSLLFGFLRRPLASTTTTLCGFQTPEPVLSYGSLELTFQTDSTLAFRGFLFKYAMASCGSNITSPTTISSPNSPDLHECVWFITAPEDKVVSVKLTMGRTFPFCGLKIYNGHNLTNQSSLIINSCISHISKRERYTSTGNTMAVQFFDTTGRRIRFSLKVSFTYGEKHNCGGTIRLKDVPLPYALKAVDVNGDGKYEPDLACEWLLLAPESHQIYLSIDKLDLQNCTDCECDFLEIYDGEHNGLPKIGRYCGSTQPTSHTIISSSGSLLVHFSSDGATELSGFQLSVSTRLSSCGVALRNASSHVQVLESPGFPNHLPGGSQLCRWFIFSPGRTSGLLSLHITDLDLPPPCSNNYLEITELWHMSRLFLDIDGTNPAESARAGEPVKLCGNRSTELTFIGHNAQVRLVTNSVATHKGFRMNYKMKGCSDNHTQPFGHLTFNHLYFNYGDSCYNLIQAPHRNSTISLYFNSFLCFGHDETPSKLMVFDGSSDSANEILSVCSTERPDPVFSTGPSLFIKWQSIEFLGRYDITYTTTDKGRGCGGRFSDVSGSFSSPPYSASHGIVSNCRWDVTVPHGSKINFKFRYFDVGPCASNHVKFFDVNTFTGAETPHSQYCGNEMPAAIQMSGDSAFVQFVVAAHSNETRWVLQWTAIPNPKFV